MVRPSLTIANDCGAMVLFRVARVMFYNALEHEYFSRRNRHRYRKWKKKSKVLKCTLAFSPTVISFGSLVPIFFLTPIKNATFATLANEIFSFPKFTMFSSLCLFEDKVQEKWKQRKFATIYYLRTKKSNGIGGIE